MSSPSPSSSPPRRPRAARQTVRPVSESGDRADDGGLGFDDTAEYFDPQPTSTSELPDPVLLMENLARCVLEVLAGARELDQLNRWLNDEVYRHLLKRVVLSARARQARGTSVVRPLFRIGNTVTCEPRDGVVEGVVIAHGKARTRAIAIRLEGLDNRWRASAIHVL